ncbi:MAG: AAA family ATPase [Deltaproteobacteria bacterium]|nr:AAA family ATPase [Deltaproteobacteria bacterium]
MIQTVSIQNFKRFDELRVDLRPFDCLVGPNNSGKTTLLQALALFDFCVHHCLSAANGELRIKSRTIAPEEFYVLPVADPVDLWTDRKTQAGSKHRKIAIGVVLDDGRSVTARVDLNYNRFGVAIEAPDSSQEALRRLKQLRIAYLPVFSAFLPQEERRMRAVIADELSRGRVHGVIRNLLLDLAANGGVAELTRILGRLFPELEKLDVRFDEANDRYISVTYVEQGHPKELDVFSAGSGFQQFVYLFGFILLRQPTVILLDEPDVHLHGTLQRGLLDELARLSAAHRQVIFATHSREMIARVSPEQILALEAGSARRLAVAFDVYDTLDRLGSVDPTDLPILQAYRRVVVVEDRADHDLLSQYCRKILGAPVWQQIERRLAFCYARGNPAHRDMATLRAQLQQMIGLQGQALRLFVVADRDYHPDRAALLAGLPSDHIDWHVWERTEIENYLLSSSALARLVASSPVQRTLDEAAIEGELARLVDSSRDAANDRLVKAYHELGRSQDPRWDVATVSRLAREYLETHWASDRLGLADAKEVVLPGLKRWLQGAGFGQFSDKALAEALDAEDLPAEVHELAHRLAAFAGF